MLSTTDEIDDLHLIAFSYFGRLERRALQDNQVVFDRDAARVDLELVQQRRYRPRPGELERVAIQNDLQGRASRSASTKLPTGRSDCSFTGSLRGSVEIQTPLLVAAG